MDRIDSFKGVQVLVVGDVMLDLWENHDPPVGKMVPTNAAPGGAANVAANVVMMGGNVAVVGVVGEDSGARGLEECLTACGIPSTALVIDRNRPTTTKLYRLDKTRKDKESREPLSRLTADQVFATARTFVAHVDAVVLSDYGKGVLAKNMASSLIQLARSYGKPVLVDPFGANVWRYEGAALIKPNLQELRKLAGVGYEEEASDTVAMNAVRKLWGEFDCPYVVTMGRGGMMVCQPPTNFTALSAHRVEARSEVGAGDSVAAALALGLGCRMDLLHAAEIANAAGAASVLSTWTAAVRTADIRRVVQERRNG